MSATGLPTATPESDAVDAAVARHGSRPDRLIEMLHDLHDAFGHVPPTCVPRLAATLNLSRADVHGVITYYDDFRSTPGGRLVVQLCRAEACQAVGARRLADHARARLGIDFGEVSADGDVELRGVFCLGNCACGPSVRIGDRLHARVSPEALDGILAADGVTEGSV